MRIEVSFKLNSIKQMSLKKKTDCKVEASRSSLLGINTRIQTTTKCGKTSIPFKQIASISFWINQITLKTFALPRYSLRAAHTHTYTRMNRLAHFLLDMVYSLRANENVVSLSAFALDTLRLYGHVCDKNGDFSLSLSIST